MTAKKQVMKKSFEIAVHGEGKTLIAISLNADRYEMRYEFQKRANRLADAIFMTLAEKYGSLNVEFKHK